MTLTCDFRQTVLKRATHDVAFARELLDEALALFLNGEPDTAKLILRDLVDATVDFGSLSAEVYSPSKSLRQMLSISGDTSIKDLSAILATFQKYMCVEVKASIKVVEGNRM